MQPKNVPINTQKMTPEDFKEACLHSNELPEQIFNYLFNPEIDFALDSSLKLNDIKLYLTGGLSFDEFKNLIKKYDSNSVCGLVWSANYVAYRCRTCGVSPCMSLCTDCFINGNHEGHDYNLFRSGAGGACDCGDENVMSKSGFCKHHGTNRKVQDAPNDLVASVKVILSHLLYRLVQYLREKFKINDDKIEDSQVSPLELISGIDVYFEFLNDLCGLGTPIRKIVADSMIDEPFYEIKIKQEKEKYENKQFIHDTLVGYSLNRYSFVRPTQLDSYEFKLIKDKYTHLLDELFFWCIKYEFPENLVKFLLVLLPEADYKIVIMELFVSNYTTISNALLNAKTDSLSTRVIHISVQLFSNEVITIKALNEYNLLPVILTAFYNVIINHDCLVLSEMQDKLKNSHLVIDPDHRIFQENLYWPIISDLINLLTHKQVAFSLIQDNKLLDLLMNLINYFQSMNLNIREFGSHVQYEQPSYYSSYSAELECCSSTMWSFIQHLKNPNDINLTRNLIDMSLKYLIKWLDSVGTKGGVSLNKEHITFHLPLHRFYSAFMYNAFYRQEANLYEFLPNDETLLIDIIRHPLRTQAGVHEIHSNMWVRNGLQMRGQAMTYFQYAFNTSFSESDLFLIQAVACKLNSNRLVYEILDAHRLFAYFNIIKEKRLKDTTDLNQQIALLNGALALIAELVTLTPNLSLEDYNFTKREIINSICQSDRTHSQIEECLPEISTYSQNKKFIDDILKEIADYNQPVFEMHSRGLKQGKYVPKSHIWENEYDPLFVILRSVKLKEFQEAFDRYCDYVKTKNLFQKIDTLWPPFRLPKLNEIHVQLKQRGQILQSKILHAFLFGILYQHLNEEPYPEKVIYFVVYILELSIHLRDASNFEKPSEQSESERFKCSNYETWFESNDIAANLCVDIPYIEYLDDSSPDFRVKRICFGINNKICELEKTRRDINESLISLLIKTMYKMTKNCSSSSTESLKRRVFEFKEPNESRIGDEFYFISNLLNKAALVNEKCKEKISDVLTSLRIKNFDEKIEKNDEAMRKKLKAQERQKRIMQQMASHQRAFLQNVEMFENEDDDKDKSDKEKKNYVTKTYDCCICRLSSSESKDRPLGLVALLQPTSVLGNREHEYTNHHVSLSDEDKYENSSNLCWQLEKKRLDLLKDNYDKESAKYASNIGWKGGIYVQTCGHYLHFDCFKSYKDTILQQPQNFTINTAGEWWCPLCRQLANCLLPICNYSELNPFENEIYYMQSDLKLSEIIGQKLENRETVNRELDSKLLLPCINDALSAIMESTKAEYRDIIGDITNISMYDADKVVFLASIIRTQIEMGVLIKENPELTTSSTTQRNSPFNPLFDVLSIHCRLNCNEFKMHVKIWNMLIGKEENEPRNVPLILYDPISILILIVLNLPPRTHRSNYLHVVKVIYNLVHAQNMCYFTFETNKTNDALSKLNDLLQQRSLNFLKNAYMLQTFLYENSPQATELNFKNLIENLCLNEIPNLILDNLQKNIHISQDTLKEILSLTCLKYHRPEFIRLPHTYSDLFLYYSGKKCKFCNRTPRNPSICLVCGAHVCYKREFCCDDMKSFNLAHINECGAGTGVFLSINSTYIYIVRGIRVAIWASLYLDKHGEEDIDLKRGKPLYLSKERYNLLTALWCNHLFDYNNVNWYNANTIVF